MKQMINLLRVSLLLILLAGCERRPLEDEIHYTALIPVSIDWSQSGVEVEKMHRASIWLFPEDRGVPLEYYLEGNLTYTEIAVPVGNYSVLVFNETIDDNDWDGISFTGTDRLETFAAMGIKSQINNKLYVHNSNLPFIREPDILAAWSMEGFHVTEETVMETRYQVIGKPLPKDSINPVTALSHIVPLPRVEQVIVTAYATNLGSSMLVSGSLSGMVSGVYLASGERTAVTASHAFRFVDRTYDPDSEDGSTTCTFTIFGKLVEPPVYTLRLDFLLNNGTLHPEQAFDVTRLMTLLPDKIIPTHQINVGYSDTMGDHFINLPYIDEKNSITVDDWEEIVIPLW